MTPQNRSDTTGNDDKISSEDHTGNTDNTDNTGRDIDGSADDGAADATGSAGGAGGRPARPTFDPGSFDPGPDLPPLPTLRPLSTIRPMARWTPESVPVPVQRTTSTTLPTVEPVAEPAAEPTAGPITTEPVAPPVTTAPVAPVTTEPVAPPVRHRRRAPEPSLEPLPEPLLEPLPEPEPQPESQPDLPASDPLPSPRSTQRVLVIGGSGAVGSAVARAMAAEGATVAVHYARHADAADELVADLPGEGHLSIGADLSDAGAVADLVRTVDDRFDGLDVVINAASAGDSVAGVRVLSSSLADWTDAWTGTLTVDVLGTAIVAHAAAAAFVARGRGGRIILLAAKGRPAGGSPSAMELAGEQAVAALGGALAAELNPYGIGVVVVGSGSAASPGWSPAALAGTVAWLASGPTSALPGAVLNIAG